MLAAIFTTAEEASTFVDRYRSGRFNALREGTPQHDDHVLILATGVGKIKATLQTERLLQAYDVDRLLHVGVCTGLTDDVAIGSFFGASFVLEGDRISLSAPTYPRMPVDLPFDTDASGTMVTQDHAVDDEEERSYWQRIADVSDTTAYAVAYVAAQHGAPCHIAKVVTGRSGEENDTFQDDRQAAYDRLAAFLMEEIEDAS